METSRASTGQQFATKGMAFRGVADLSIGFDRVESRVLSLPDGTKVRELLEVKLWEVSVVTFEAGQGCGVADVLSDPALAEVEKLHEEEINIELATVVADLYKSGAL